MLDIAPNTESRPHGMLSLDFSPYLLSASPPSSGFSLDSLCLTSKYTPCPFFSSPSPCPPPACARVYGPSSCADKAPLKSIMSVNPKDGQTSIDSRDDQTPNDSSRSVSCLISPENSSSRDRVVKRVSFADDVGRPLTEVRLMLDNPLAPPLLTLRGLGGLSYEDLADADSQPPTALIAPEQQPLDRPNFEEDLRINLVAVENVVVRGYELTCTIFVNNRPSSKRVFGRCTLDSWKTHQDVPAHYSQTRRPGYDSYQFTMRVPASADRSMPIQFAVCFEADGVQHWDNNEGRNYTVHWNRQASGPAATATVYSEDSNANGLGRGGLLWCPHDDLDQPYY